MKRHDKLHFITSRLVKANLASLEEQMNNDTELKDLLTCPAKYLPDNYWYLIEGMIDNYEFATLYDVIYISIYDENGKIKDNIKSYFSVSGDRLTGWCAYTVVHNEELQCNIVNEIKMFSSDVNRPNTTLIKDLKSLIDILLKEYPVIQWTALKDNPANRIYQRAIKEYGGYCYDDEYNSDLVVYEIENEKFNGNQNFLTI